MGYFVKIFNTSQSSPLLFKFLSHIDTSKKNFAAKFGRFLGFFHNKKDKNTWKKTKTTLKDKSKRPINDAFGFGEAIQLNHLTEAELKDIDNILKKAGY